MSKVKTLNTNEAVDFVNKVVEQCFREGEEGVIEYYPHLFDVTMRLYEMQMYGGIEYDGETDIMEFAYGDAYDDFVRSGVINTAQLEHLAVAIHEQIEWNKQKLMKQNEARIVELLVSIAAKKTPLEEIDKALAEVVNQFGEKFESVDWAGLADNVKELKLDPEAFVNKLMDKKYPIE